MAASPTRASRRSPGKTRPLASPPDDSRAFLLSMIALVVLCIVVHVVSTRPNLGWMWGAHFFAFFPPYVIYAATAALVMVTLLLASQRMRVADRAAAWLTRALAGKRYVPVATGAVLACATTFWTARICHTYLGDGAVITHEIDTKHPLLPREPLTSLLQYAVYGIAKPWFAAPERRVSAVAQDAIAVGSVAAGICFLVALWFLADELSRLRPPAKQAEDRRAITALLWLCLAAQGYMQLFFGYVENYSFYAAGLVVFLWLCLRCLRHACALLWPALALCVAVALHLSAAVLALPFAFLAATLVADPAHRRGALRDLGILAVIAVVMVYALLRHGINPIATMLSMAHTAFAADSHNRGYRFSIWHYRDFLNEQILIGPLGIFLFITALLAVGRSRPARPSMFLIIAGAAIALTSWMAGDSNLGYARDWDLFSPGSIVFTTAGLGLFVMRRAKPALLVSCLGIAWLMSLYHTVPWIATNHNEARSFARLKTLPLGFGRTEVLIASWYEERGDPTNEGLWLERSIAAYRDNPNSYYKLGMLELGQNHYSEALLCFDNALRCRPSHTPYRLQMVRTCFLTGRPDRAVPHLKFLNKQFPDDMTIALYLGEALAQSGGSTEAVHEFEDMQGACTLMVEKRPADARSWATYGWVLFRVGDEKGALSALERAVAIDPTSQQAQCYLGFVLRSVGRSAEARAHFTRSRAITPDLPAELPDRAAIMAWLSESP